MSLPLQVISRKRGRTKEDGVEKLGDQKDENIQDGVVRVTQIISDRDQFSIKVDRQCKTKKGGWTSTFTIKNR